MVPLDNLSHYSTILNHAAQQHYRSIAPRCTLFWYSSGPPPRGWSTLHLSQFLRQQVMWYTGTNRSICTRKLTRSGHHWFSTFPWFAQSGRSQASGWFTGTPFRWENDVVLWNVSTSDHTQATMVTRQASHSHLPKSILRLVGHRLAVSHSSTAEPMAEHNESGSFAKLSQVSHTESSSVHHVCVASCADAQHWLRSAPFVWHIAKSVG